MQVGAKVSAKLHGCTLSVGPFVSQQVPKIELPSSFQLSYPLCDGFSKCFKQDHFFPIGKSTLTACQVYCPMVALTGCAAACTLQGQCPQRAELKIAASWSGDDILLYPAMASPYCGINRFLVQTSVDRLHSTKRLSQQGSTILGIPQWLSAASIII